LERHRKLVSHQPRQEGGLALQGKPAPLDLLIVLQLDLKQADHFERQSGGPGYRHSGVGICRKDLTNLTVGDEVALGRLAVASHDDAVGVSQGENGRSFGGAHRPSIGWNIQGAGVPEGRQEIAEAGTWSRDVEQQRKTRSRAHSPPFWM
jgi:hypothetical protein